MGILNRRTRRGVFEISSGNGLISIYALCRARGEGGKPDPKLEALLAEHAQRLKEKQEMAKLVSSADSYPPVSSASKTDFDRTPVPPASNSVKLPEGFGENKEVCAKRRNTP